MKKTILIVGFLIISMIALGFSGKVLRNSFFTFKSIITESNINKDILKDEVKSKMLFFAPPTNDDCSNAITVPVNTDATCTLTTTGNFNEANLTTGFETGCNQWAELESDVWYKFTATATTHVVSFTEDEETFTVSLQLFNSGICTAPADALYCGETIIASNLVVGNEYLIRVFKEDSWNGATSDFHLCVRTMNLPVNDECSTAVVAPVNPDSTCTQTVNGTFVDATISNGFTSNCDGWQEAVKDVWYEFTATQNVHDVTVGGYDGWSLIIEIYTDCTETDPIICTDGEYLIIGNLNPGTTYKIRVLTTNVNDQNTFTVCVGTPTPPDNDECGTPTIVPVNEGEECEESIDATFEGSTLSQGFTSGCDDWETPYKDVWFKFTATSSTHGISFSNYENDFEWELGVEVYNAGPCNTLTAPLSCSTDVSSQVNDLIVGNEYLIRVFSTSMDLQSDFTICINTLSPPIYVSTTDYTVEELVTDVLVGNPCLVSNISWSTGITHGPDNGNGIAYFNKNGSVFTLEDGILLTTGSATNVVGPANQDETSGGGWPGDQQLFDYMVGQGLDVTDYNDASILEFDFIPTKADFSFDFIFGSNEYGTFQCDFSDAFAFFLTDIQANTTTNLAVVPNSGAPISVTTIRKAIHSPENWMTGEPQCGDANPEFFDKCYDPDFNGLDPMLAPVNLKGHTVPMTASTTVVPGKKYHIKMVIADRNDNSMDSSVFLLGGSFDIGSIDFGEGLTFDNDKALCYGDSYVLDTGLGSEFTFEWFKDGVVIPGATGPSYTVTESGTYKVIATFGDTDCGLESSLEIEFYPDLNKIVKDPKDIIICDNVENLDLTIREQDMIEGLAGSYNFSYYPTLNDLENNTAIINNPANYSFNGQTTIFVKVVVPGENSCHAVKELLVDVLPVKEPKVFNDLIICQGYKLPVLPEGQRYFTGSAATGDELKPGQVLGVGTYDIYVYTSNKECFKESEFQVIVTSCIVPKGISPNGDGINDGFDIAKYYPTSLKIYNRYGKEVYKYDKVGYTNQWMGQDMNNNLLPTGTYFYKFTTEIAEYSGYVQLEREIK